jgi:hypothetical protein
VGRRGRARIAEQRQRRVLGVLRDQRMQEAGGVVTHADGRSLDSHPAVGSGDGFGLAVLASASPALHALLQVEVDQGMARVRAWLTGQPA